MGGTRAPGGGRSKADRKVTMSEIPFSPKQEPPPPPLAERMRPLALDEFVGQEALLGSGKFLRAALEQDRVPCLILWGPPGSGKTSLARLIARQTRRLFLAYSAVAAGVRDMKEAIERASNLRAREGRGTILFLDEIHRFNKAQQDSLLHHVEDGTVTLIGATTENPSFEVNAALLSRCRVLVLEPLPLEALRRLALRALADGERGLGRCQVDLEPEALALLCRLSDGDARNLYNLLEPAALRAHAARRAHIETSDIEHALGRQAPRYDKAGEEHYNLISALHKSMRGSDAQAAVYWTMRMLESGEDPLYIARRMVRFAAEDIGNADPQALVLAVAARDAAHFLGMPEADAVLIQLAAYLATAPKSNAAYVACGRARAAIRQHGTLPVPLHLRNAPTALMHDLGYGRDYKYPHDVPGAFVVEHYLPKELLAARFYLPRPHGFEREIKRRIEAWERAKEAAGRHEAAREEDSEHA
ncbi:MAG: replication-associated recombination protein A [Planctomycetota bacterium]